MRYWRLQNTGIWLAKNILAITWEPDFSHICSFRGILDGRKYFQSTPFLDKTDE